MTHQEASIDVLKVMSSTSSDTTPVFNTILNRAVRLCDGLYGTLFQFDGTLLHLSAIDGFSRELSESFASQFPRPLSQSFASGRAILSRQVVIVRDTGADADLHQSILAMGHKSLVALPLLRDGDAVGALVVGHASVDGFSDAHVALLKPFAEQAVIAIGSVATFRELQRRTADLTEALEIQSATADVLKVISRSAFDLDTVLDTLTRSAATLCGAETGSVRVRHGEGFRMGATYGLSPEFRAYTDTMPMQPGRGSLSARIMLSKTIEHIPDFELDPELGPALKARTPNRAALGVPLLREGRLEGWFILGRRAPVTFTQRQIDLVQTFADQAMIAIENARLFEEVQARTRELSASLDELRAAQDRLVQTEKLASLGQLTAGIAHEIKNPLNFVNNFSALSAELVDELRELLAPVGLEARVRDEVGELTAMLKGNLEKVVAHGKRADGIVRNMLLHSREGGDDRRLVQLNTIVEEALNLAYHGARAEKAGFNVTLERDYDVGAGVISMYPQEFTRVLLNLIGNGFYASATKMREGGDASYVPTVTVRTVSLAEEVEVRVRDNGTGIPDAVRAKMFNPFFTTKPAGEGTGLGLSLSHDIVVKQHGGRIEVETEPGEFTEFIITLPRGGTAV